MIRVSSPRGPARATMMEFGSADDLVGAVHYLKSRGYTRLHAFSPYPIKEVIEAITPRSLVAPVMLCAGFIGAGVAYVIQWWCAAVDFPINVGGRPLNSSPAFIPIAFETAVLFASVTGFLALLIFSRLPRLHDPVFEVDGFDRMSTDRFWVAIDQSDAVFDIHVRDELSVFRPLRIELLRESAT